MEIYKLYEESRRNYWFIKYQIIDFSEFKCIID